MRDWAEVAAFALTLPHTEASTSYGQPAIKTGGRMFVSSGQEAGSFHVRSPFAEKEVLIDTDSATFWQTPHYAGWPGLLVRYGTADADRVRLAVTRAWWDMASITRRMAFSDRP